MSTQTITSTAPSCGTWSVSTLSSVGLGSGNIRIGGIAALGKDDVWAVGSYGVLYDENDRTLMLHWDGNQWHRVSSPSPKVEHIGLRAVAGTSSKDIWAMGNMSASPVLIEHWDGSQWTLSNLPIDGTLSDVAAISPDDVWAVGRSFTETLTLHWNGTTWNKVPSPLIGPERSELYGMVALNSNDIWAVGDSYQGNLGKTLTMHWDGTSWSLVPSPNLCTGDNGLVGLSATGASDIWAAGNCVYDTTNNLRRTLVEHWDGRGWSIVPSLDPVPYTAFYTISAIAPNDVWAVGSHDVYPTDYSLVEHWDGTKWDVVPGISNLQPHNLTNVAALSKDDIWMAGGLEEGQLAHLVGSPCSTPAGTAPNP